MWMSRTRNRQAVLVATGLIAAIALAGCSATSKSNGQNATAVRGVPEPGAKAPGFDQGGGTGGKPVTAPTAAPLPPGAVQRAIIYNGNITVRVTDVNATAAQAQALAIAAGGYVGGDDREIDAGRSSATLILRVPSIQFEATVSALGHLGKEQSRQVSTQDVTENVVDVQARLKTQQASVDRIRALLAQATSINEIVAIESELTNREADLESLEAQLRSLTDLTSLSTITVTLLGPEATLVATHKSSTGFVAGLKSGWHAFQASLAALLTIIGALLPFAVVIGIPLLLIVWLARRRRARRPAAIPAAALAGVPGLPMAPPIRPVPVKPPAAGAVPPSAPEPETDLATDMGLATDDERPDTSAR